jgi:GNAT superfamily N-acetyltransferase
MVLGHHHIRPLNLDDGPLLDRVMEGMSAQSRYQRYHVPKPALTPRDRAFFTAVDERDHLALIALDADGEPLGVARAVRLRDDPAAAEVGAEVIDARHGEGLGSELTARLACRAAAVGIRRLIARVLFQSPLAGGLQRRGWRVVEYDGPVVTFAVDAQALSRAPLPAPR